MHAETMQGVRYNAQELRSKEKLQILKEQIGKEEEAKNRLVLDS